MLFETNLLPKSKDIIYTIWIVFLWFVFVKFNSDINRFTIYLVSMSVQIICLILIPLKKSINNNLERFENQYYQNCIVSISYCWIVITTT